MSYYPFRLDNLHSGWYIETGFASTLTTDISSLDAATNFFHIPANRFHSNILPMVLPKLKVSSHVMGQADFGSIVEGNFPSMKWNLSGELSDLSWMHKHVAATVTTAGSYTHTYATSTARAAAPSTIGIILRFINDTSAQSIILNLVGTIVPRFMITGRRNSEIMVSYSLETTRIYVVTTDTTTIKYPVYPRVRSYHIADVDSINNSTYTYFKTGGTAYQCTLDGFSIDYSNGSYLHAPGCSLYATSAMHGPREIKVGITITPKEKALWTDFNDKLAKDANNIDIGINLVRTTTTDELKFTFDNLYEIDTPISEWANNYHLGLTKTFILKPRNTTAYGETGTLTIVEGNNLAGTRYA